VVATALAKDIVDVLEKLALEAVVVEVYAQCAGTVVCHPYNLEQNYGEGTTLLPSD
jgi:hypothetical protein